MLLSMFCMWFVTLWKSNFPRNPPTPWKFFLLNPPRPRNFQWSSVGGMDIFWNNTLPFFPMGKAGEHVREQADARKVISDKNTNDPQIENSQFVYLYSHPRGRNKIQDDPTLYKVQDTPGSTGAVYIVIPAHRNGPRKPMHRTPARTMSSGRYIHALTPIPSSRQI